MRKTIVLLTLLAFSMLSLPAVSGVAVQAAPAVDTDYRDIFLKAGQNLLNQKSYRVTMDSTGSMLMDGKTTSFVAAGQADVQLKPTLIKNTLTVTVDAGGKKDRLTTAQYVEETGDKLVVYANADNKWTKQVMTNPGGNYGDYRKYFDNFIKGITTVKLVRETDDALVLEATVSAGYLQESIEQAMSVASGRKIKLAESLFDDLEDFRYTAVIAKDSLLITEVSLDMAGFVGSLAQNIIASLNLPDDQKLISEEILKSVKIKVKISLSRYNAVEAFTIPPDAKSAPLVAPPAK